MIEKLLFASIWCLGVYCIFSPNYILGSVGEFVRKDLPRWVTKPLFDCPPCMASVHGTLIHFTYGGDVFSWIPFVVCLSGLNYFATQFFTE